MFDSHVHLQDPRFDTCREAVLAAAAAAGVTGACCCGTAPGDWTAVEKLEAGRGRTEAGSQLPDSRDQHRRISNLQSSLFNLHSLVILPAFGVHPWFADHLPANWLEQLETFLQRHPHAPIGEIGMDGLRDEPPRALQRQVLTAQLELAVRLQRPVVLHGARAWGELLTVLRPFAPRLPGFQAHGFGGSADILRDVLALGGCVSFAGTVCNPAATRVRAAAVAAPAGRLLIETDAPDLLPKNARSGLEVQVDAGACSGRHGGRPSSSIGGTQDEARAQQNELNTPANLVYVARTVAELRGVPVEELAAAITANAMRLFFVPRRPQGQGPLDAASSVTKQSGVSVL